MVHNRTTEIAVGLFVVMGFIAMFFMAMKVSNLTTFTGDSGYHVKARFDNIGGLKVRSPVTMAGVRIGRVAVIEFDDNTYEGVVTLAIQAKYGKIPKDSSASIFTAGLLGEQYISLDAGGAQDFLVDNDDITLTQSALVLEQIIGQFLFSKAEE